ncbi:hypothetical protein Tco_0624095 [Tanacetum coccineum]|uniref:Reverse transcriptase domain-containing protein n=1 Tax=Tanacetum coccineum TaxID=301880 RepID=A0ABQ4WCZ3_9ASTR
MLTTHTPRKAIANRRSKPLEFEAGDMVLLKCLADENIIIPLDQIQLHDKLHFIEELVEIVDREVKRLKQTRIPIIKVHWNSRRGPKFTWERKDQFRDKYPSFFTSNDEEPVISGEDEGTPGKKKNLRKNKTIVSSRRRRRRSGKSTYEEDEKLTKKHEDVIEDGDSLLPGFMRRDIDSLFGRIANLSRRLCSRETVHALVEKKGKAKDKFYGKLILYLGNEARSSMEQGTAAMENLVRKLGNVEEKAEYKKLKKELEEARLSNTFLCIQNERVERDLYWTRVRAHEFYQEMIRKGFVIMPPKSAPMTQVAIRRMIKESVDATIAAERARQANVRNDASGSGPVRGQDTAPTVRKCTFAGFMKCNPTVFYGVEGAVKLRRWFEKTKSVFKFSECAEGKKVKFDAATLEGPALTWWKSKIATMGLETVKEYNIVAYTQRFNELAMMYPRIVDSERVKVDAFIRGLTDNIKGEVASS